MRQTWRWFGPADKVSLAEVRQAGAAGIVTALHHVAPGAVWPEADIAERKAQIAAAGLSWDVVESLPVSEAIKTGASEREAHVAAWVESLHRLARERRDHDASEEDQHDDERSGDQPGLQG